MALSPWRAELAVQAIHGAAADCSADLLVCRYAGLRNGLSFVPAIWSAGAVWPNDLYGLDFEIANAPSLYGSNPCRDGLRDYCHTSQRDRQAVRPAVQGDGQGRRPFPPPGALEARLRLRFDLAKLGRQHRLGVCLAICGERDFLSRLLQFALC